MNHKKVICGYDTDFIPYIIEHFVLTEEVVAHTWC